MKAVVLIGGKGTRLRPITYTVPKAMVPLRNRPYIQYLIDNFVAAGFEGAVLSMGYLPDPIQRYFAKQDLDGFSLEYVVESSPLGTAGGLKNVEDRLGEGPFVVTNGDVLTSLDLLDLVEAHQGSGALATIALTSVEDPTAYGLVEVDHHLYVKRFIEKPSYDEVSTNLVNSGIYVIEHEVLDMIPRGQEVSIEREVFPKLQAMGQLRAYVSSAYWQDIGTPDTYLQASHDTLSGTVARTEDFQYLSVYPSAQISEAVTLLPPICIADKCEVEAGATVGGRSALGKRCVVKEGALVEGSVLFEGVRVEEGAVIRNSIVGPHAVVGKNTVVRGLCVIGAQSDIGEGNILDKGISINRQVSLPKGAVIS